MRRLFVILTALSLLLLPTGAHATTYAGNDPHTLDNVFGKSVYAMLGDMAQKVATPGEDPGDYHWATYVNLNCHAGVAGPDAGTGCVQYARMRYHGDFRHTAKTQHSYVIEAQGCNATRCGYRLDSGFMQLGPLFIDGVQQTFESNNGGREYETHGYGQSGSPTLSPNFCRWSAWYGNANIKIKVSSYDCVGPVDPANPTAITPACFTPNAVCNESTFRLEDIIFQGPGAFGVTPDADGNAFVWLNAVGLPTSGCTGVGPNCFVFMCSANPGYLSLNGPTQEFDPAGAWPIKTQ